ncbi:MAG: tRNA (adenosine(37)-N6)-dimethylallyltransferase MiaA [Rhodothermales bacterium]
MEPFLILTGPTAVGKTALSMQLAAELDAEIISADSRQVYRELNVGTAKPDEQDLQRVRHHFINERILGEAFTAGIFQREAYARIEDVLDRGRTPLIVGGSTLYLKALKHGLANIPDIPEDVRADIRKRLDDEGPETLYAALQSVDPQAAETMDPTKSQRIARALEVYEATGTPITAYHDEQPPPPYAFLTVVLHRDRRQLYDRINRRVDRMLDDGLIEEVRQLLDAGHDLSINLLRTIGYKEPVAYLRGEISHDEMVRRIKRNTRRYAKRQLTWFRRDEDNVWVDAAADSNDLRSDIRQLLAQASDVSSPAS